MVSNGEVVRNTRRTYFPSHAFRKYVDVEIIFHIVHTPLCDSCDYDEGLICLRIIMTIPQLEEVSVVDM